MCDPILDGCLFKERCGNERLLYASVFGMMCTQRFDVTRPIKPLSSFWQDILKGVVPDNVHERLRDIIQIVGVIHATKGPVAVEMPRYELDPEPMYASGGESCFFLTRNALVMLELYVFGMLWGSRKNTLTQHARLCRPAANPERVRKWLLESGRDMPSSEMEYVCRMSYCAAMTPVTVALQGRRSAYETYRDYQVVNPSATWADMIELVARNTPNTILGKEVGSDPVANTSAAIAIVWAFLRQEGEDMVVLRITSGKDAGMHWCDPISIYFQAAEVFMCVAEGVVVKPASLKYEDIVFALIDALARVLPGNKRVQNALLRFNVDAVNPLLPDWAC